LTYSYDVDEDEVVIGYTVTAGLVVAIITVYYFVGYQPDLDPFQREQTAEQNQAQSSTHPKYEFRPNPIDELLLRYRYKWNAHVKSPILHPSALERVLLKVS
jgi:hypothetical protein